MSRAHMVDISGKADTPREAVASGFIRLRSSTIERIRRGDVEKGDPLRIAEISGILAAKQVPTLIPLTHPIPLTNVEVRAKVEGEGVKVTACVKTVYKTGCELEALTATAVALLTVFDVVKQYEKDERGLYPVARIERIEVVSKAVER